MTLISRTGGRRSHAHRCATCHVEIPYGAKQCQVCKRTSTTTRPPRRKTTK